MKKIFYFLPKTRAGRFGLWGTVIPFLWIVISNIIGNIINIIDDLVLRIFFILPGLFSLLLIIAAGITSFFAFFKYKDYALILIIPWIIGLMGIFFAIGEIIFEH